MLLGAFCLPAGLTLSYNFAIIIHATGSAEMRNKSNREKTTVFWKQHQLLLRLTISLSFLLGITWLFGILVVFVDSLTVQYIFAILNTIQGVFILLLHFTGSSNIRKEWTRRVSSVRRRGTFETEMENIAIDSDDVVLVSIEKLSSDQAESAWADLLIDNCSSTFGALPAVTTTQLPDVNGSVQARGVIDEESERFVVDGIQQTKLENLEDGNTTFLIKSCEVIAAESSEKDACTANVIENEVCEKDSREPCREKLKDDNSTTGLIQYQNPVTNSEVNDEFELTQDDTQQEIKEEESTEVQDDSENGIVECASPGRVSFLAADDDKNYVSD